MADVMWSAPEVPISDGEGSTGDRRSSGRHGRGIGALWAMAIILLVVAALSIVALIGLQDRRSVDEHFVAAVRDAHHSLSPAVVSDDSLVALGRRSCSPQGLSSRDRVRLHRLGIDADVFASDAETLCPQR